jgi:hypothetical protein
MSADPWEPEPEPERVIWLTLRCSRCAIIGQPTADGHFTDWGVLLVKKRGGGKTGVAALDVDVADVCPLCIGELAKWFASGDRS